MSRHHSPSRLGKGLQARSLTGNALAGSATGRALGWYARRLVDRAVTMVFEDRTLEDGCDVLRYVEYTVLAPTYT